MPMTSIPPARYSELNISLIGEKQLACAILLQAAATGCRWLALRLIVWLALNPQALAQDVQIHRDNGDHCSASDDHKGWGHANRPRPCPGPHWPSFAHSCPFPRSCLEY